MSAATMAVVPSREQRIQWREYARIAPGVYSAYCRAATIYLDKGYRRHVCLLCFDVLAADGSSLARVPLFYSLGQGDKPRAGRRSKYFADWLKANGGPPVRADRLSPQVFVRRIARVEIADTDRTKSPVPYSVVRRIVEWETGPARGHSVNKSPNQVRQHVKPVGKPASGRASSGLQATGKESEVSVLAGIEGHHSNKTQGRAPRLNRRS
jgi:hypothetical protein